MCVLKISCIHAWSALECKLKPCTLVSNGVSCSESRAPINELTHESRLNWNKLATLPGVCAGCESHAHHPCKCALCADAQMCIKCTFLGNYLFRLIIKLLLCIIMQLFLYRFTVLLVYLLPVHPIIQMQLLNVQC